MWAGRPRPARGHDTMVPSRRHWSLREGGAIPYDTLPKALEPSGGRSDPCPARQSLWAGRPRPARGHDTMIPSRRHWSLREGGAIPYDTLPKALEPSGGRSIGAFGREARYPMIPSRRHWSLREGRAIMWAGRPRPARGHDTMIPSRRHWSLREGRALEPSGGRRDVGGTSPSRETSRASRDVDTPPTANSGPQPLARGRT